MKHVPIILYMLFCTTQGHAQKSHHAQLHNAFGTFRNSVHQELDSFRQQCWRQYLDFAKNPWKEFEETAPVPFPKEEDIPPLDFPDNQTKEPIENRAIIVDELFKSIQDNPQPSPIESIEEVPNEDEKWIPFTFYGTQGKVRFNVSYCPTLHNVNETSIVAALQQMTGEKYNNILHDCLALRSELHLCDWAYLQMLLSLSETICGKGTNEAILLLAYLYMHSGYQMRMAMDGNRLYLLYASTYQIYDQVSYEVDGHSYYGLENLPARLFICQASFPKEQKLSLQVSHRQRFALNSSEPREIRSLNHPEVRSLVQVNKNLIDFYNSYPTSMVGGNFMTRWAMYANTPLQEEVKEQLYPELRKHLEGKSQKEAVGVLLDFVQMAFVYGYDDKVWGYDRAFFAEETLFYPYADCEDRSILFSRLVRDLLGLKVVLVYYPGHLATAVQFTEQVIGDYLVLNNQRFVVCDPTYFNASVGLTMTGMDNKTTKVI